MKGKEEGHQALQAFDGLAAAQVAISHLRAIAFTLITKVAAVVLIAGSWGARQRSTFSEPTQQARLVAAEIGPLVARGNDSTDLNVVLRLLVSGDINAPIVPFWTPPAVSARSGNAFSDVAYVVGPDGHPVALGPTRSSTKKASRSSPLSSRRVSRHPRPPEPASGAAWSSLGPRQRPSSPQPRSSRSSRRASSGTSSRAGWSGGWSAWAGAWRRSPQVTSHSESKPGRPTRSASLPAASI